MMGIGRIRQFVGGYRHFRSVARHRSRMARGQAERYARFLQHARVVSPPAPPIPSDLARSVEEFRRDGFTSFHTPQTESLARSMFARIRSDEEAGRDIWTEGLTYRSEIYAAFPEIEELFRGDTGHFFRNLYGSHFKIYYGLLYKSENKGQPAWGSQLWHSDGGPGTCTNVMFYLHDVSANDGAMEALPWDATLDIYRREYLSGVAEERIAEARRKDPNATALDLRQIRCDWYREQIDERYMSLVAQPTGPAGLVLPFLNNILHKGGYPHLGRTRYVCVFHVYPSDQETPFEDYRRRGIAKRGAYPVDPAEA